MKTPYSPKPLALDPKKPLNTVILLRIKGYICTFERYGITIKKGDNSLTWNGKEEKVLTF